MTTGSTSGVHNGADVSVAGRQFATFYLDQYLFGIEVLHVQEVLRYQDMTRVPTAPDVIEGLINLRGQIVTALDMRRRLRMPARPAGHSPMNVVVRSDDGVVSLLVDEIGDVVEVDENAFERPPDNIDDTTRDLTTGVYKLKDRLLLVLDTKRAIDTGAAVAAAAGQR